MKPSIHAMIFGLYSLLCSPASHAAFIDHDTYTTDTTSGLDWLDVTATLHFPGAGIATLLSPGGEYAQWRIATGDEFNTMVSDFMGSPVSTYGQVVWDAKYGIGTPGEPPPYKLSSLQDMLGRTSDESYMFCGNQCQETHFLLSLGEIADTDAAGARFLSEIAVTESISFSLSNIGSGYIYEVRGTTTAHIDPSDRFARSDLGWDCAPLACPGYYLVRDTQITNIPEPAPYLLMLAGLSGFAFRNRQRGKAQSVGRQ
jgi:hypothetical protein